MSLREFEDYRLTQSFTYSTYTYWLPMFRIESLIAEAETNFGMQAWLIFRDQHLWKWERKQEWVDVIQTHQSLCLRELWNFGKIQSVRVSALGLNGWDLIPST